MAIGMEDLEKDPRAIKAASAYLVRGESVLWAARQYGLGRRGITVVFAHALFWLVVWTLTLIMALPSAIFFYLALASPFYFWWLVEMLSRQFVATDRRVLFISSAWPFRCAYWNFAEMNEPLVRLGKDRGIIHLGHFMIRSRGIPIFVYNLAVYPTYLENVREIEHVRSLILSQIARGPAPIEEAAI